MAATAPAYAASACDALTISSFPFTGGAIGGTAALPTWSRTVFTPVDGGGTSSIKLSATTAYVSDMQKAPDNSPYSHFGTIANAGGVGGAGLEMFQRRTVQSVQNTRSDRGTYTYTFDRAVTNLTFTLTDIDYNAGQYDDRVELTSPNGSFTIQARGSEIVADSMGVADNPFRPSGTLSLDPDNGRGNVRVNFAGPITSFVISYWNGLTSATASNRQQVTCLTGMSFTYKPCA